MIQKNPKLFLKLKCCHKNCIKNFTTFIQKEPCYACIVYSEHNSAEIMQQVLTMQMQKSTLQHRKFHINLFCDVDVGFPPFGLMSH